jgi:hypothetical protein
MSGIRTHNFSCDGHWMDCIGSCKFELPYDHDHGDYD